MSGGSLAAGSRIVPPLALQANRILLRLPLGRKSSPQLFGPWNRETLLLTQYQWNDGTPLLNTSTRQLHLLQANQRNTPHTALSRWSTTLACQIPPQIWSSIWQNFHGASENTFMWQILYQCIATQSWRFPRSPASDPATWCKCCQLEVREDIVHCLWTCPVSASCWRWCEYGLGLASMNDTVNIVLNPSFVFVAWPLPLTWQVPSKIWQILRPVLFWQIWKDRNAHFLAQKPANHNRIIRKSWHRLGMYLRKEWRYLVRKVHLGKISASEAEEIICDQFGRNPTIWNLHGLTLEVPPVPPRPP